ncbi:volume-regulated anion channel subunit LRRC8D-like [Poeciliopsis prolifica]|uniref:volume-regulated anion channel subunit LRRC8D-like n=1 Tax=Poeciliopsis prolifica TaxID=188132 RepID=UPI00241338B4|nr:volume-regulated anion channel subunit LRRC8D-like [Poeciliopsis prolifica]
MPGLHPGPPKTANIKRPEERSCERCLRRYSFHSLKDIPDLMNDLAFLIHMLEQNDPLLVQRLSMFLSPVSESRLLEQSLERHWGEEKLQALSSVDAEGCSTLQLVALPRLPPALFTLSQLHALKLELIADAKFTLQVANMTSLRELHCPAAVDPGALAVLQERLEVLHITFSQASQIPSWVLSLRNLHELHLSGRLGSEGGVGHGWAVGSLRQLCHLRVLVIHGMLDRVPSELCEVAGSLVKLEIHNEGARLLVLTELKRMADLTELRLLVERWLFLSLPPHIRDFLSRPYATNEGHLEDQSRPESDTFPYSPTQWSHRYKV